MRTEMILSRIIKDTEPDPHGLVPREIVLDQEEARLLVDRVNFLEELAARLLTSICERNIPIELPYRPKSA